MSRAVLVLNSPDVRARAAHWCQKVPAGTRVEFRAPSRTLEQNARMWAMLSEVAAQVEWHGQKLAAEDWKDMFTAALRGYRVVPGLNAGTFVPLGMRTSDMSKEEMSDLMELIAAFGAERGVRFHDETTESSLGASGPGDEAGEGSGDTTSPADPSPASQAGDAADRSGEGDLPSPEDVAAHRQESAAYDLGWRHAYQQKRKEPAARDPEWGNDDEHDYLLGFRHGKAARERDAAKEE